MSKEAMTLALEALCEYVERDGQTHLAKRAMPELRKALAKQEQGELDELKHIGEQDCLLDVDEKAWLSLVENRGGCRCHLSPPCGACTNPISEEEMNEVGYTYTTPQPAALTPPEGWKLVPIEPTPAMKSAGIAMETHKDSHFEAPALTWEEAKAIYKAMLAAAPQSNSV